MKDLLAGTICYALKESGGVKVLLAGTMCYALKESGGVKDLLAGEVCHALKADWELVTHLWSVNSLAKKQENICFKTFPLKVLV